MPAQPIDDKKAFEMIRALLETHDQPVCVYVEDGVIKVGVLSLYGFVEDDWFQRPVALSELVNAIIPTSKVA